MNNENDKKPEHINTAGSGLSYEEGIDSMDLDESFGNVEPAPEQDPDTVERKPRSYRGGRHQNNRAGGAQNTRKSASSGGANSRSGRNPGRYSTNRGPRRYDNRGQEGNNEKRNAFQKAERTEIKIKTYIAEGDDIDKLKAEALLHLNIQDAKLLDFKVLEEGKRAFLYLEQKLVNTNFLLKLILNPLLEIS